MKKFLTILSSFLIAPSFSTLTVACDPIESIPSKSYQGTTKEINVLFNNDNGDVIKPYDLNYLFFINDSWEHFGFESSLSSNKIDNPNIVSDDNEFINILNEIYKSKTPNDFTGMTIVVENIFVNSIDVKVDGENYETTLQSDLALTIKKGWKEQGKILASINNSPNPLNKEETFSFINKIIEGIGFGLKVSDKKIDGAYQIIGNIENNQKERFISRLSSSTLSKMNLNLDGKIIFSGNKTMTIDGVEYKFV
ncbi:hypothetical protein [Spiroplasma monobiae]|uniref:Lipoprotein n=1 Tax=Spiroplasma monobiae MQ-1 TaxID=1336748 RepID=A0A2K9LUA4_SPISQ|nr:hypothetical protein [Spiroplasma monobiae]AUM62649.1 hypothetical protein SMONO_v1c04000 [Spiroplasma monobiae MQ-1]